MKKHPLIAIHQGKYYKRKDGLAVGPGFIVKGLEYTASTTATVIGKPTKYFFESAIPAGVAPEECVMIGDVSDRLVHKIFSSLLKELVSRTRMMMWLEL